MTDMYFIFGIAAVFGIISFVLNRDETIKQERKAQMEIDHAQTCNAMIYCTRNDCERLIDAFYERWSGVIDDWELSTRTAALYKRVIEAQKQREEMLRNQDRWNKRNQ